MRVAWILLIGLAAAGLALCLISYDDSQSSIHSREFNWRGVCVYFVVVCFGILGFWRRLGPVVFFSLLAAAISVTFVFSGVNAVAQFYAFVTLGFATGLVVEYLVRRTIHGNRPVEE